MPYRKIGTVRVPRAQYLSQYAQDLMLALGDNLDKEVAKAIDSLGKDREYLKNFFFERLLLLESSVLDAQPGLKFKFITLLNDFLNMTGYIPELPIQLDYITDPVYSADTLLDLMLGTRMPKWEASAIGGENAQIGQLRVFFSEVIRRYALITRERPYMAQRLRQWLGSIGFKLMTQGSSSLSQAERSFLTIYGNTQSGSKGFIECLTPQPIPPVENKDPLVVEVGALAVACALPGPCFNHMKLVSNGILEQLVFYYGPHVSDLKTQIGYVRRFGPYISFDMTQEDGLPWVLESQITGITAMSGTIMLSMPGQPPFTLRVPLPFYYDMEPPYYGKVALYPDAPDINLYLTNQTDISEFVWDFPCKWQGRRISSLNDGGTMDYYLADIAASTKTAGGLQVELPEIPANTLCWFSSSSALQKLIKPRDVLTENFILPGATGVEFRTIPMAAFYARFGTTELIPPFAEYLELPVAWFMQPDDRVVDFIATVAGLTLAQRSEFKSVIELCHNIARYERITGRPAPIDARDYASILLFKAAGANIVDKRTSKNQ